MNNVLVLKLLEFGLERKFAVAAAQVFADLREVKKYWDITYTYHEVLKKVILHAKRSKNDRLLTFIPVLSYCNLSYESIQEMLSVFKEEKVHLAIIHPDSTTVYYQISEGLVEPEDKPARNIRESKHEKLDANLKKHSKLLEEAALYGIPITLAEKSSTSGV